MEYKAEGYVFGTEEEARLARKEAEGIRFIRTKNDMNDPGVVLRLYNRLIEKQAFATPVGFAFLEELREYLLKFPYIKEEHLVPLPVYHPPEEKRGQPKAESGTRKESGAAPTVSHGDAVRIHRDRKRNYYKPFLVSTFLAVVFGLALIGIFVITAVSSDNVTILNYENSLIDKYESWEENLTRREEALAEREQALEAAESVSEDSGDSEQEFTD